MRSQHQSKPLATYFLWVFLLLFWALIPGEAQSLDAKKSYRLQNLIGSRDAVLVAGPQNRILFSKHANAMLVPASTLKIFTALVAIHYLGVDYRFPTDFFLDASANLKVKGYGDPLLISEALKEIAKSLGKRLETAKKKINDLVLDDAYFAHPILIPGVNASRRPHDAPNGALCVNFNTVCFKRLKGAYVSAEPDTPLLPSALKKIKQSGLNKGRIIFSHHGKENMRYAGELLLYFMKKEGITVNGRIRPGRVQKKTDRLILRYTSKYSLKPVISKLLEYSNNFMANQILIASGAKALGPPGTLDKGVAAALTYAKRVLDIENLSFVEGSGISRKNRISATVMNKILGQFVPYHLLMRRSGRVFYKTGTLYGINTRAGYIEGETGALYRFAVLINSPGKSIKQVMDRLLDMVH